MITAKYGKRVATEKAADSFSLMMPSAIVAMKMKSTHHQSSDFVAQPLKSAYFVKHVRIDSVNVITPSIFDTMLHGSA